MLIKNAVIYRDDFQFHRGEIAVKNGLFTGDSSYDTEIDVQGKYLIPGLIDIHMHGNSGTDFSTGNYEGLVHIAGYLLQNGITSFVPASTTLPEKQLETAFAAARKLRDAKPDQTSRIRGINMEGPFFNSAKKGAQNEKYLLEPDFSFFERLNRLSGGLIRIACIAPELDGALEFIEKASATCTVSLAHTTADYETATRAFSAGASHVTHLFNAMPPLGHREPGVIGAAAENEQVTAELIADGIHIHPSAVRAAFKLFGPERLVLISDSMAACGMPDGEYELGGQKVNVHDRKATLADGTIAGSATNLFACLRQAISFGIKPEDAVRAATFNPARVISADRETGSITEGKSADFVVCNQDWTIDSVYLAGQKAWSGE